MELFKISVFEATGGAVAGVIADTVLYGIDSAKVRAQSKPVSVTSSTNINKFGKYKILFRGLVPTVMLGSVPVFATFFMLYAPLKHTILSSSHSTKHNPEQSNSDKDNNTQRSSFVTQPELLLPIASAVCCVPATIVGVPADVLKKRLVLGIDPNIRQALTHIASESKGGSLVRGLFAGWHVNLIRDIPFAVIKIGLYEFFVQQYIKQFEPPSCPSSDLKHNKHHISPLGAGICGVASGVCCAIITAPLDVINTHIKAGSSSGHHSSTSILQVGSEIVMKDGIKALYRGVVMRSIVMGVGSFIFWPIQRSVAQALESHDWALLKTKFTENIY